MQLIRSVFNFYIYSNIHVALAAFSLTKISLLIYDIDESKSPLFVFFATIVSYNFIRSFKINEIDIFWKIWVKGHKKSLIILNIISLIFLIFYAFSVKFSAFLVLLPFTIATFFYIVPFRAERINLRSVASLKLFLIAITWAGITVLFPLVQNGVVIESSVLIIFLQRFLIILALTIPFDIRDLQYDKEQLNTLPQLYGVINSKIIAGLALVFFLIIEFLQRPFDINSYDIVLLTTISLLFIIFSKENQNRYYTTFWVEAIPIFWYFLLVT
ncbi:MAG: hypothetical protein ABFR32_00990 [Bacteroidota bacterium]